MVMADPASRAMKEGAASDRGSPHLAFHLEAVGVLADPRDDEALPVDPLDDAHDVQDEQTQGDDRSQEEERATQAVEHEGEHDADDRQRDPEDDLADEQ